MSSDDINEWWIGISDESLSEFIQKWFAEIDLDDEENTPVGSDVVLMNFLAPDEFQWKFIVTAFELAYDATHLETMAAGPVEHLLGFHGDRYISQIEELSSANENFAWMMKGVWQHKMSDEIWARVQRIQEKSEI
ncbi:DUF6869 domain-containing protein [Enterovibrio norvegicus]|uniref:DUF6869 domain-containing protein n=1 Tax=Enterovibrio norvegicus TaxID=188144 RepID=UPI0024B07960|nr:hypothetical protein [Enterovibrio norvegicus]